MRLFRVAVLGVAGLASLSALAAGEAPGKKRRPLPQEFGRVVIANYSEKAGLPPVVFEHWLHRAKFTCRACHVDVGFAMKAGATDIKGADNASGVYCGACHNDRTKVDGKVVFGACTRSAPPQVRAGCFRCHALGKDVTPEHDFATFTKDLPRGRFGNGVDWEKAEQLKLVRPADFIEGMSIRRSSISAQKDFALNPKMAGMPDIIFSHVKHTAWNGCELCHPEIFVGVSRGATKYSMAEIFDGKYCGVCHTSVAFPLIDCQRCHTGPVR